MKKISKFQMLITMLMMREMEWRNNREMISHKLNKIKFNKREMLKRSLPTMKITSSKWMKKRKWLMLNKSFQIPNLQLSLKKERTLMH